MRGWSRSSFAAITLIAATSPARALAQLNAAVAEVLFEDGKALFDRGEVPAACRKFEDSVRLDPLPGSILNLAVCHEAEGRVASAWAEFKQAAALARADGRKDRQSLAEERIAALEPTLPKLSVARPPNAPAGLELHLNGRPLGAGSFEIDLPVDPGPTRVRVEAPGFRAWETELELATGKREIVTPLALEPLPAPPPLPRAPDTTPPPPLPGPPLPARPVAPAQPWATLGWAVLGGGAAVAAAGFATGAYALSEEGLADDACAPATCPDDASLAHSEHARVAATVATVLVPIGLGFAAGGAVVGLTATFAPGLYGAHAVTVGGTF